jgi:hypothetical protein
MGLSNEISLNKFHNCESYQGFESKLNFITAGTFEELQMALFFCESILSKVLMPFKSI